jgi:type IV fimbrial biogenesis protein FimT
MKRAHAGFTLLELMVVLAIAGVLMAVGIPAMGDFIRNSRITSAANDVMAALHFARSEAIKRRRPVTLCASANAFELDGDANPDATCAATADLTGWIVFVDSSPADNPDGQRDPAGELLLLSHAPMNDQITARSSANPLFVTYLANGFAENVNGARIALCDERGNKGSAGELSSARGILVSVTGRAGVTRDPGEIQELLDVIGDVGGCEAA